MRRSCRPWSAARKQPRTEKENAMTITTGDRKSTRLNSSHSQISYAVFCLKKKTRSLLLAHAVRVLRDAEGHAPVPRWATLAPTLARCTAKAHAAHCVAGLPRQPRQTTTT